jgi:vanillate O-demethylase ferredoxin subunit
MAASNIEVWQLGTVVETVNIATDIQRLVLEPSMPRKAEPGSHIDVMVRVDGHEDRRSYSVVGSSADGRRLVISVLKAPLSRGGSKFIHSLKPGDELQMTQPLQNFPLRVGAERYMLLAGGIGITAMMNMAGVLKNLGAQYTFAYAGRTRPAMAYLRELQEIHGRSLAVHVDDEGTSLDVNALVAQADEGTELYMCGPIRLMDAVRRVWAERGLSFPNLRYETFGNSGWHDPEEFVVKVPRLNLEVKVGQGRTMLEALEDAGADMMFDCRKGECGLCEVRILQLEGSIDHRDVFYSARQKSAAERMACCVSRAVTSKAGPPVDTSGDGPAVVTIEVT